MNNILKDNQANYKIIRCKDLFQCTCYFGYKDNRCYTEGFDTLEELKEQYQEFKYIKVEGE